MLYKTKRRPGALAPAVALIFASLALVSNLLAGDGSADGAAGDVPADGWIVWTSVRDGGHAESFRCRADGTEVTQLTKTGGTYPIWSPDGRWIAYRDNGDMTHLMRPDGSGNRLIGGWHLFWMHDNAGLAMLDGDDGYVLDPDTGDKTPLFKRSEFVEFQNTLTHFYAMTHDRRYMFVGTGVYDYGFTGANGTFQQGYSAVLVDMLDKRKIYMVGLGCWPFTPPAGDRVYHIRGDGPTWPDIYRMNLADLLTRSSYEAEVSYPDPDWGHEYHPQVSNDNQWLVYMASQGCHWDWSCNNEIFIHKLGTDSKSRIQVTYDDSFDAFPSIYVGTPWTPTDPARLVLSPNKITFFARNASVPATRTVLAKSSAPDGAGVTSVTVATSASWLDASVDGNKITVGVRAGQVFRGRCQATLSVTVPGLEGSPGLIPIVLDADDSFAVAPSVSYDAGAIDADPSGLDGGTVSIDAASDLAVDTPVPCEAYIPPMDAPPGTDTSPASKPAGGGCGCSLGQSPKPAGAFVFFLLAFLIRRSRRTAASKSERSFPNQ
jgi:hypothetical protein